MIARALSTRFTGSMATVLVVAIAGIFGAGGACSLFDDGPPPLETGGSGSGGGAPETCTLASPRCLLPRGEAVRLCSLVADCDALAATILRTTGLPLAVVDASGHRTSFNTSVCVDWLTTPLEGAHPGFDAVRAAVNCLITSLSCEDANGCFEFEQLSDGDDRCAATPEEVRCDGEILVDCPASTVTRCDGPSFAVNTHCEPGGAGVPMCRSDGCEEPSTKCAENQPGTSYVLACTEEGDEIDLDCAKHGLGCTTGVGCSNAQGAAPVCTELFAQTCDGPFVRTCAFTSPLGLLSVPIDCSAVSGLPRACEEAGASARCASPDAACSPFDPTTNVCREDNRTLALCVGGEKVTFDCGSIGLACANASEGLSGRCLFE